MHRSRLAGFIIDCKTDRIDDMQRLLGWGADALITNRPDLAVIVRDRFVSAGQFDRAARP